MASFRFSLPAGTSKVQLGDGTVLVGVGRTVVADSMYSAELVRAGCTRLDPVATTTTAASSGRRTSFSLPTLTGSIRWSKRSSGPGSRATST